MQGADYVQSVVSQRRPQRRQYNLISILQAYLNDRFCPKPFSSRFVLLAHQARCDCYDPGINFRKDGMKHRKGRLVAT